jgi:predicted amidohydrolase YtcJ
MIAAYTINAAHLMQQDDTTGSIEKGKTADLIVLDHDLLKVAPNEIRTVRVLRTLIDGQTVYPAAP